MRTLLRFATIAALLVAAGCARTFIPNTDVLDTSANRQVIAFCEQYRHDLEDKKVGELLKMMSPGYFETGGNAKSEDDADYEKVREFLTGDFLKTSGIRYEMRYRRITFTERDHIYVDYTFAAAWRIPGAKGDEWHHKVADNRLDLVHDGETFKITRGM
jgi:hypothetical protein